MISVAMTTFNGEAFIEKQLQSILNQTLLVDEIIICDDNSTDNTIKIIENVIERVNSNITIKIIKNKDNIGYISNFYKAISETRGDTIFLSDQDDEWHSNKIEKMMKIMQREKCVAICTNFNLIDENSNYILDKTQYNINPFLNKINKELNNITFRRLVFGNIAQGCTYCFTKKVKEAYLKVRNHELIHDHQIMFISTLIGKVYFYNEELIDYRIHSSNAVGFTKKASNLGIEVKKPSRKPFMVKFLDDLDDAVHIPYKVLYVVLYYLRIPYFVSKVMFK